MAVHCRHNASRKPSMQVSVKRIAGNEADELLVQSDRYMAALYPAESNHLVSSASLRGRDALSLGAFTDQDLLNTPADSCIGCVAARFYPAAGYAEIKRLFVDDRYRGHAIARTLMAEIEQGIVAQGKLDASGTLQAVEVLAKHDENYMPPEVAEALQKSGKMPMPSKEEFNK